MIRAGFREAPKAQFILHSGDLVHRGKQDRYWGEWFRAGGWINATIPSLTEAGSRRTGARSSICRRTDPKAWKGSVAGLGEQG